MLFKDWKTYFINQNCLSVSFNYGEQSYIVFLTIEKGRYSMGPVYHNAFSGLCDNCGANISPDRHSLCYLFLVNGKEVKILDDAMEEYISKHLTYGKPSLSKGSDNLSLAIQRIEQLNLLLEISALRKERPLFYDANFTRYYTVEGLETYETNLLSERKLVHGGSEAREVVSSHELLRYLIQVKEEAGTIEDLEKEILHKFDIEDKKKIKLQVLIGSVKEAISLFEEVHEKFDGEEFQQLIVYLNEVLYREIPLEYDTDEEFLYMHQEVSETIYQYVKGGISYDECVGKVVRDPTKELDNRKDRVIFAVKALKMAEEVFFKLQQIKVGKSHVWFQDIFNKIYNYLRLDLGVTYQMNLKKRQEQDDFLYNTLRSHFTGQMGELETYRLIDERLPFVELTTFEKINHLLQIQRKNGMTCYLMEIPKKGELEESLRMHVAYKSLVSVKAVLSSLDDIKWSDWVADKKIREEIQCLFEELVDWDEAKIWEVAVTPKREGEVAEYIVYTGETLYRLLLKKP
jgi:hypothetical protein